MIALGAQSTPTTVIERDGAEPRVIVGFRQQEIAEALGLSLL